ncbi:MBL fold metallo-hydrolase [Caenispirillum bisanense]|uniref:MBL fold metallo-hydrolase n=1 Tax=Caenispirillum bisanense TaxID=414052 RepID=UPI0031DFAEA0
MTPPRSAGSLRLTPLSGLGGKHAACFLIDDGDTRLLLDLGAGSGDAPPRPDLSRLDGRPVDAVLLSHQHEDHIGGLDLLPVIGSPPVHATAAVARAVGRQFAVDCRPLPLRGRLEIGGLTIRTGRSGHAPGGVWLHVSATGTAEVGGILYMGDHSGESRLFAQDAPPPAAVVVLDASYGVDDVPQGERTPQVLAALRDGPVLLPAPPAGRGVEMAVAALQAGLPAPALCPVTREAAARLLDADAATLRPGIAPLLARLVETAPLAGGATRPTIAVGATLEAGPAVGLAEQWRAAGLPILLTGHVPAATPARALLDVGAATWRRWNVHPPLRENRALVQAVRPRVVVPAFGRLEHAAVWAAAFAPATVRLDGAEVEASAA